MKVFMPLTREILLSELMEEVRRCQPMLEFNDGAYQELNWM